MATMNEELLSDALALPTDLRVRLVERLLESLNPPIDAELERLWAEEAERRIEELETGQVQTVSGEEVFQQIRMRYRR